MKKNQLKIKVITSITLVLLLVVSSILLIKPTYAVSEINIEENVNPFDEEYTYNLIQDKLYTNIKDISPLTNLLIVNLSFDYKLTVVNESITINDIYYPKNSTCIILTGFNCILRADYIYNGASYSDLMSYNWKSGIPQEEYTQILMESFPIIYTSLNYETVKNGNYNLNDGIKQFMPEIYFNIYDISQTNELNNRTRYGFACTFIMELWTNGTRQQIRLANKNEYRTGDTRFLNIDRIQNNINLNLDLTFKDINYIYIDNLVKNSTIYNYLKEHKTLDTGNYENIMTTVFGSIADILEVEVFPNITIGLIIGIPLLLGLLLIILKFIRG